MEPREAIERAHEAEAARTHGGTTEKFGVVLVAVLAAMLAIAAVFGRQSVTRLLLYQEQAVDAKNIAESNDIKARVNDTTLITLRVFATDPDTARAAEEASAALQAEIEQTFRPEQERLERRADELDEKRDTAQRRYESFEIAETVLQMAIVFATIATAVHSTRILLGSLALAAVGAALVLDGFLIFLPLFAH